MFRIIKRYLLIAGLLFTSINPVYSGNYGPQSDPELYRGFIPSAAQWNSYFALKLDYVAAGLPINLGGTGATTLQGLTANLLVNASGPTSSRPTNPVIGQFYLDTTLGLPVWCEQIAPSVIWINASGVSQ